MDQKRDFGRIFFPDKPDQQIDAWLTITPYSISLEASFNAHHAFDSWPIILGRFNGMNKVTFVRCYARGGIDIGGGGPYTKIAISYCISGEHYPTSDQLMFRKVTFRSSALRDWIMPNKGIESKEKGIYRVPENNEIVNLKLNGFNLQVVVGYTSKSFDGIFQLERICEISITADKLTHINDFGDNWARLKKLILFITNKNPEFTKIYLFPNEDGDRLKLINTEQEFQDDKFSQGINIYYHIIKDQFQGVIKKWFTHKELDPVIDLLLEKQRDTEMWAQGFFLAVCIAIETFHGEFGSTKDIDQKKLEKRDAIITLIEDQELLTWFTRESSYWGKPDLRSRLFRYRAVIETIKGTVFSRYDMESFVGKIVQARNELTHSGNFMKRFTFLELFLATKILEFTLRIEILKILEIDVEQGDQRSPLADATRAIELIAVLNKI